MSNKLEKLLIGEVSGVDDPANEIPGWLVAKSAVEPAEKASVFTMGRGMGPDQVWDVGAAENRIRDKTAATDGPNNAYASTHLWFDGDAPDADDDGLPDRFGDYKFLVCDVVDDKIKVMPRAVRAAASRLPGSKIPAADKDMLRGMIDELQAKTPTTKESWATKLREILNGKEEIEMTKDEMTAALDERLSPLADALAVLAKAVETPSASEETPASDPTPPAEAPPVLKTEDVTATVEAALAPVLDLIDKTLDRVERIERAFATRLSLDGQEEGVKREAGPTLKDAIGAALKGRAVELR